MPLTDTCWCACLTKDQRSFYPLAYVHPDIAGAQACEKLIAGGRANSSEIQAIGCETWQLDVKQGRQPRGL
jgi:hypothetical protein